MGMGGGGWYIPGPSVKQYVAYDILPLQFLTVSEWHLQLTATSSVLLRRSQRVQIPDRCMRDKPGTCMGESTIYC